MSDSQSFSKGTPMHTPRQSRPYLNNNTFNFHQTPMQQHFQGIIQEQQLENQGGIIYGTTINVNKVLLQIQKFILEFKDVQIVEGEVISEKIYLNKLHSLQNLDEQYQHLFNIDGRHLREFDRQLYFQLIYFPAEMVSCFDNVLRQLFRKFYVEPATDQDTRSHLEKKIPMLMMGIINLHPDQRTCAKNLNVFNIGKLVLVQGIVIRVSDIYPEMKKATFRCVDCKLKVEVLLDNARVAEPDFCPKCRAKNSFEISHNECHFTDKQYVKFQELPELVEEGSTPSSLNVIAYDSNVDSFRPGDRVEVIGIYRIHPLRIDKKATHLMSVFDTYIDLISVNLLEENKNRIQEGRTVFSDNQKRMFYSMAQKQTIIDDLVQSLAPSIYGHEDVKKGLLAQLFSGSKNKFRESTRVKTRSDINICLVGDPSTAKSQLLQHVYKIAPRCVYTNGRGSSAVGLTANVRKDPQTNQFILQSGALVLSDLGICCIDQFDKMDENSRIILLQSMQQQTISIAKAGIVCQLNTRTSILAAANPVNSKYDPKKSVVQNINLSSALLSRFDLIYIILDIPNATSDQKLATHILDFYSNKPVPTVHKVVYTTQQLAKYITYAKQYYNPTLTQKSGKKIKQAYLNMRKTPQGSRTISATPRQLESLIRISEAFAKMRLSIQVSEEDVDAAINLLQKATLFAATDPITGLIDMGIITTGRSQGVRRKNEEVMIKIKQFLISNEKRYRKSNSFQKFLDEFKLAGNNGRLGIQRQQILQIFNELHAMDFIAVYGQNKSNPQFKLQVID